ncbi:MAG TPA: hypothetical protein VIY48_21970 [Candidatus Paceibacterota bacterium]
MRDDNHEKLQRKMDELLSLGNPPNAPLGTRYKVVGADPDGVPYQVRNLSFYRAMRVVKTFRQYPHATAKIERMQRYV